jgi:Autographiviridae endonuclease
VDEFICSIPGCEKAVAIKSRGWCAMHYQRWHRQGTTDRVRQTPELQEHRFWKRAGRTEDTYPCWLLRMRINAAGYSRIIVNKKDVLAHRYAWIATFGPIPNDLQVCHTCDIRYPPKDITYRLCVNPHHLVLGTATENMAHLVASGRKAVGEASGVAKLTANDVFAIRELNAQGFPQSALASEFEVSVGTVSLIIRRRTWKHLP